MRRSRKSSPTQYIAPSNDLVKLNQITNYWTFKLATSDKSGSRFGEQYMATDPDSFRGVVPYRDGILQCVLYGRLHDFPLFPRGSRPQRRHSRKTLFHGQVPHETARQEKQTGQVKQRNLQNVILTISLLKVKLIYLPRLQTIVLQIYCSFFLHVNKTFANSHESSLIS